MCIWIIEQLLLNEYVFRNHHYLFTLVALLLLWLLWLLFCYCSHTTLFQICLIRKPLRDFHQMSEEYNIVWHNLKTSEFFSLVYFRMNNTYFMQNKYYEFYERRMKHIAISCSANEWFEYVFTKYTYTLFVKCFCLQYCIRLLMQAFRYICCRCYNAHVGLDLGTYRIDFESFWVNSNTRVLRIKNIRSHYFWITV